MKYSVPSPPFDIVYGRRRIRHCPSTSFRLKDDSFQSVVDIKMLILGTQRLAHHTFALRPSQDGVHSNGTRLGRYFL